MTMPYVDPSAPPPPALTVSRPPLTLPYSGIVSTPQATTAVIPPPKLSNPPGLAFPYGATAGASRPY